MRCLVSGHLAPEMAARLGSAMRVLLFAVHKKDAAIGPATRWLIEKMGEVLGPTE